MEIRVIESMGYWEAVSDLLTYRNLTLSLSYEHLDIHGTHQHNDSEIINGSMKERVRQSDDEA